MEIRELLQIGRWSKRTTRRILVGFGAVVGLVVGFGVLRVVQRYWLTPGERDAGKVALARIDALQKIESIRREDFDERNSGLAEELRTASEEAWTDRDNLVYSQLSLYYLVTESEHRDEKYVQQSDPSTTPSNRELHRKLVKEEERSLSLWLHNQLD
jgi:hypothetical protein